MAQRAMMKKMRIFIGYTQYSLAKELGLTENDIGRIETGRKDPMPSTAIRIAELLKCDAKDIFPEVFGVEMYDQKDVMGKLKKYCENTL